MEKRDAAAYARMPQQASEIEEWEPEQVCQNLQFRSNNSRSRAFILALASLHPHNVTNGVRIDTAEALSAFNKKQFHHIYPKNPLKNIKSPEEPNSLINICMLTASENNRVSDRDPKEYLPERISNLGDSVSRVFMSNLLPTPESIDYASLDYDKFLHERAVITQALIRKLCQGN